MVTKHEIIVADYQGVSISIADDGWFNATAAAAGFEKRPVDWLRLPSTVEYLEALTEQIRAENHARGISEEITLIRSKRNSGTWMHPDLAVQFARWLDVRFAIWCDRQIRAILTGAHPHFDRQRLRHEVAASYKVMSQIVQLTREAQGKECAPHHFVNEAKLVNWAASGKFQSIERNNLSASAMDLLAKLEERNAVMIGMGKPYEDRKPALQAFAAVWIAQHAGRLEKSTH